MIIHKFASQQELNEVGAGIINALVQVNPHAILGLATGGTPVGMYEEMVKSCRKGLVSYKHATTFNLDEYAGLQPDHPESYHAYMKKHLFDHIDIQADRTHIPNGNAADLQAECERYEALLEQTGPVNLQILGIGHNGHIGFNEPAGQLNSRTHVVELDSATREANARFFNSIDEVPTQAITMGVGSILKAKTILLLARGADKADIIHRALTGPITTECPASLLQMHPNVIVLLDEEAGSKLS